MRHCRCDVLFKVSAAFNLELCKIQETCSGIGKRLYGS